MALILHHSSILVGTELAHFTRMTLSAARPNPLHSHDFFELFWVQNGEVRHHNSHDIETLVEGDVVLIPPGPAHGVQAKGALSMIVSVCLHPDIITGLQARHNDSLPRFDDILQIKRNSHELTALNQSALKLERSDRGALATEAFLLPLLFDLQSLTQTFDVPDWLSLALKASYLPDVFRNGSAGLVAQTGRVHAHVSRSMRKYIGKSPSEFINEVRMTYAARQLLTDDSAISEIAADCGIPNMAHFHKLFREFHGMTPLKYRQKLQRDVVQPK